MCARADGHGRAGSRRRSDYVALAAGHHGPPGQYRPVENLREQPDHRERATDLPQHFQHPDALVHADRPGARRHLDGGRGDVPSRGRLRLGRGHRTGEAQVERSRRGQRPDGPRRGARGARRHGLGRAGRRDADLCLDAERRAGGGTGRPDGGEACVHRALGEHADRPDVLADGERRDEYQRRRHGDGHGAAVKGGERARRSTGRRSPSPSTRRST